MIPNGQWAQGYVTGVTVTSAGDAATSAESDPRSMQDLSQKTFSFQTRVFTARNKRISGLTLTDNWPLSSLSFLQALEETPSFPHGGFFHKGLCLIGSDLERVFPKNAKVRSTFLVASLVAQW